MIKKHYPAIFISDIHLGSRGAQAELLLEFLKHNTTDHLYLVGDVLDFWALRRKTFFPEAHLLVIRTILNLSTTGTKVTYLIGNHDEDIRAFLPLALGEITCANEAIHVGQDGRRYLVVHGDAYDQVVMGARWLAFLGDIGYAALLRSNRYVNVCRQYLGYRHWSLSAYVKSRVKGAVSFIGRFEEAVTRDASSHGVDGVICGHIHTAEIRRMGDLTYLNDGDWVESCTAIVEEADGSMRLVRWLDERQASAALAA